MANVSNRTAKSEGKTANAQSSTAQSSAKKQTHLYKSLQFYWFLGHALTVIHFTFYSIPFNVLYLIGPHYHQVACLLSILVTYGIVILQFFKYQKIKKNSNFDVTLSLQFFHNIIQLDNFQYFFSTLTMFLISIAFNRNNALKLIPNSVLLSPTIYSLFHCLNYICKNNSSFTYKCPPNILAHFEKFITNYNAKSVRLAQILECTTLFQFLIRLWYLPLKIVWSCNSKLFHSNYSLSESLGSIYLEFILSVSYIWFFKMRLKNPDQKLKIICNNFDSQFTKFFQNLQAKYKFHVLDYYQTAKNTVVTFFNAIPV
ncbi:hypothetical protein ACO0QE_003105 [Hanseniaspora vineae]